MLNLIARGCPNLRHLFGSLLHLVVNTRLNPRGMLGSLLHLFPDAVLELGRLLAGMGEIGSGFLCHLLGCLLNLVANTRLDLCGMLGCFLHLFADVVLQTGSLLTSLSEFRRGLLRCVEPGCEFLVEFAGEMLDYFLRGILKHRYDVLRALGDYLISSSRNFLLLRADHFI